jgi:uncharacterized protein YdeI (YjbR/CyaY-like superfamily)
VKSFSALLERAGDKLNWVVVRLPFDSVKLWGTRGTLRVKGEINGFTFRSSIFPTGDGRHMMLVNKKMLKEGRARPGTKAKFRMAPDLEERVVPLPAELDRALKTSRRLRKFYDALSGSMRNYIASSVAAGKAAETRVRRAEQTAEWLMETMEAEIELPPLLRLAFARNPEAAEGWRRLSASHRRRHLLSVFYPRGHDARLKRIDRMMAELMGRVLGVSSYRKA